METTDKSYYAIPYSSGRPPSFLACGKTLLIETKRQHKFYCCEDDAIARDLWMIGQEEPIQLSTRHSVPIGVTINNAPYSRHTRHHRDSI